MTGPIGLASDNWQSLSDLLDQALEIDPADRPAWLDSLRESHCAVLPELRALLSRQSRVEASEFLNTLPKLGAAPDAAEGAVNQALFAPGTVIGPYVLDQEIGRGGMGLVYRAHRADNLVKRPVALKLLHPTLQSADLLERFARERDILASLNHPNIARLYDAGATESGQPYIALEFVEGMSLTEYCDRHKLSVRARLELLGEVLRTVQYAHANLVIHRDLKPSNILVTTGGEVRLLDFGIAKLLQDVGERADVTQLGGRALTPDYASPEQLRGDSVSTASDVYSLGVVLYELLCGTRPYGREKISAAALEEAILHKDPVTPSQRAPSAEIAAARATTARALARSLAGDLDTIVLKALKKAAAERYATADAFRQDLRRYLAGEPVLARPDSLVYRFTKTVQRHRLAIGVSAVLALTLVTSAAVSIRQAQLARREAKRAEAVQDFVLDIFRTNTVVQPDPLKARRTTAQELLDIGARRVTEKLSAVPEAEEQILDVLANMYFEMGLNDRAAELWRKRIEVLKQAYGARDPRVASTLLYYAADIGDTKYRNETVPVLLEVKEILDFRRDDSSPTRGKLLVELARFYRYIDVTTGRMYADQAVGFLRQHPNGNNLIDALRLAGQTRTLLGDCEAALALNKEALDEAQREHPNSGYLLSPLVNLAETQAALLDIAASEHSLRTAQELARHISGPDHVETIQTQLRLGALLYDTSRREEGRELLANAVQLVSGNTGAQPSGLPPQVLGYQAVALLGDGRLDEVAAYLEPDLNDLREHYPASPSLAKQLGTKGRLLIAQGHYEQARSVLDEALTTWQRSTGTAADPATDNRFRLLQAQLSLALGRPEEAIEQIRSIKSPRTAASLPLRMDEVAANVQLAQAYLELADFPTAIRIATDALDQIERSSVRRYYQTLEAEAALRLGQALDRSGRAADAAGYLERAVALREANEDPVSPWLAEARIALARCVADSGDPARARELFARAKLAQQQHAELGKHFTAPLRELGIRLGVRT